MEEFIDRFFNRYVLDIAFDSVEQLVEWFAAYAKRNLNLAYVIDIQNSLIELVYMRNDKQEPCRQRWYNIVKDGDYYKLIKR